MFSPKALARGSLISFVVAAAALSASPALTSGRGDTAAPERSSTSSDRAEVLALTSSTPAYYAAGHLARLQQAPARVAATTVVISEFRTRGPNSNNFLTDEFVELYNPTASDFPLDGWSLWKSTCASGYHEIIPFDSTDTIPAFGHYLIAGQNYSGFPPGDRQNIVIDVDDDGGLALLDNTSTIIDQVGMCGDGGYFDPQPLTPITMNVDWSYDRNAEVGGLCSDSNDNAADFFFRRPSDPQNSNSPVNICGNPTPFPTSTLTPTITLTPTVTQTRTATATRTPLGFHPRVIINEVAWSGTPYDEKAQWIELYNPGTVAVNFDEAPGWQLRTSSAIIADLHGVLDPGEYYLLVAGSNSQATTVPLTQTPNTSNTCITLDWNDVHYDQVFSVALSTIGQAIFLDNPSGFAEDTADRNSRAWPAGTLNPPKSMERSGLIPDTTLGAWFTFEGSTASTPRDCDGNHVRGTPGYANWAITVTMTPSPTPAPTKKPTARPPTPFAHMVINEFLPRAGTDWNQDGQVDVRDEFIELKNLGPIDVDLANWKLDDVDAAGSPPYTLPSIKLKSGERVVFYGSTTGLLLEDSGDTVRLINNRGIVIDARGYGVIEHPDVSHCRIPDGYYWRTECFPTPGNENALSGTAPQQGPISIGARPACLLPDTVPEPFRKAECEPYGEDMWDRLYWDRLAGVAVLPVEGGHTKWKTSIQ